MSAAPKSGRPNRIHASGIPPTDSAITALIDPVLNRNSADDDHRLIAGRTLRVADTEEAS